jgi:hypothetical protein
MTEPHFNGDDYIPERDFNRLETQHARVRDVMMTGRWLTLRDIAARTDDPEPSISAQLRHLRKPRFGGFIIEKRFVADGLYEYRLLEPVAEAVAS